MKNEEKINVARTILMIVILILMLVTLGFQIFPNHLDYGIISFCMGSVVVLTGILMILDCIIKKFKDCFVHTGWLVLWLVNFIINLGRAL